MTNEQTATPTPASSEPTFKDSFPIPTEEEIKENGFYYYYLPEQQRVFYQVARKSEGLKEEIGLMQVKIMYIQAALPTNLALLFRAVSLLDRLINTQARLFSREREADPEKVTANLPQQPAPSFGIPMNRAQRRRLARGPA